jgi:hypothetical protein
MKNGAHEVYLFQTFDIKYFHGLKIEKRECLMLRRGSDGNESKYFCYCYLKIHKLNTRRPVSSYSQTNLTSTLFIFQ